MILTTVEVPDSVPAHLRKPLGLLTGEVQDLHCAQRLFWDLCVNAPDNVALINQTAPHFFKRITDLIFEHLIFGIARLTDGPSTGKHKNLTFDELFDGPKPPQVAALQSEAKDIREIRNKIVVHLDLGVGYAPGSLPNQGIFAKIRRCTELMVEIVNLVWHKWAEGHYVMPDSDAMEITNCLQKAVAYDRLEKAGAVVEHFWNAPEDMKQDFLGRVRVAEP